MAAGVLTACGPPDDAFLAYDRAWLARRHGCALSVDALAQGDDAEALTGLSTAQLRTSERVATVVAWSAHEGTLEKDLTFSADGDPDEVVATRSLVEAPCPLGLVLEQRAPVDLELGATRVRGHVWIAAGESEPSQIYRESVFEVPSNQLPRGFVAAIEPMKDDSWQDYSVRLTVAEWREARDIVAEVLAVREIGLPEPSLARYALSTGRWQPTEAR